MTSNEFILFLTNEVENYNPIIIDQLIFKDDLNIILKSLLYFVKWFSYVELSIFYPSLKFILKLIIYIIKMIENVNN